MAPSSGQPGPLQDLCCVVTGGNSGIGKEVTRGLVAAGADVVVACRNQATCGAVAQELQREGHPGRCSCSYVDLEDLDSVKQFSSDLKARLASRRRRLHLLINNAGVMGVPPGPDSQDRHLDANHYGPYLLTRLLLPAMGPGSRVVTVSSRAHLLGRVAFAGDAGQQQQPLQLTNHPWTWFGQYARSKLANVMFTAELRKRVSGLGVAALAVSPGFVATPMVRNPTPWFLQPLVSLLAQTPAQGARTVLFAATAPHLGLPLAHQQAPAPVSSNCSESQDAASTSSPPPSSAMSSSQPLTPEALLRLPLLLHDCKPAAVAAAASNADGCARLWALSAKVVGLGGPQQQSKGGHQDYL